MNLLVITVDALRKETLACYNQIDGVSVGFEEFYNRGIIFDNLFTVLPETYPALGSLFTGLYPFNHKVACEPFDTNIPTLFDYFKDSHRLFIFTTEPPLGESLTYEQYKKYNMFDLEQARSELRSDPINLVNLRLFIKNNKDRDFFLTTHLWMPRRYHVEKDNDFSELIRKNELDRVWKASLKLVRDAGFAVKEIFDMLTEFDLLEKTVVLITSDHGDYFSSSEKARGFHRLNKIMADNPGVRHTEVRLNPVVNIPGILYHPMLKRKRKYIKEIVANIDILPTLMDFFGKKITHITDGISLIDLLTKNIPFEKREIFIDKSFTANTFTIIDNEGWKLIFYKSGNTSTILLYNFFSDPEEEIDLADIHIDKVNELLKKLKKFPIQATLKKEDIIFRYLNYKNIEYVREIFNQLKLDDWERKAEALNQIQWLYNLELLQTITSLIRDDANQKILEVGIGTGILSKYIKKQRAGCYFGIDTSPSMLSYINKEDELDIKTGDAHNLAYSNEYFDVVLMRDVLHYLKNPTQAFREIFRVLKVGGQFILCEEIAQDESYFEIWDKINTGVSFFRSKVCSLYEIQGFFLENHFKDIKTKDCIFQKYSLNNYLILFNRIEKRTIKRKYHDASIEYKKIINFSEDNDIRSGQPYGDVYVDLKFGIFSSFKTEDG